MAGVKHHPLKAAEELLHPDLVVDRESVERAPGWKGAYLLVMRLDGPARFERKAGDHVFVPGWYAYAGNARGPGGVGARLRRHFRRDKKPHWHVDRLTQIADCLGALIIRDGSECAIAARLAGAAGFQASLAGFGSSDCRTCTSHLLEWRGR